MKKVTLFEFRAFFWICPKCKTRNQEEMVPAELTPKEMAKLEKENGVKFSEMKSFQMFVAPERVTCQKCSAEFETEDQPLDDFEEEGNIEDCFGDDE